MKRQQIKVKSWNRFHTRNLVVGPEVLGKEHCFQFENSTISIKIPTKNKIDRRQSYDEIASVGARRSIDNEPLEFHIHKVDLEVLIPLHISIPSEALNRNANAHDLFSGEEQKRLNNTADQHQLIAEKAFDYWIRIVRWVCDNSQIGRDLVNDFHTGWSTSLIDIDSGTKVWIQSQIFRIPGYKKLSIEEWRQIQHNLSSGSTPPIYIELKHDAEEHLKLGDYRSSLLELAIACETFLRFTVRERHPGELSPKAKIRQYINKFFPEVISEAEKKVFKKEIKSGLHTLFNMRNGFVHMGKDSGINAEQCLKFLELTQKLFSIEGVHDEA